MGFTMTRESIAVPTTAAVPRTLSASSAPAVGGDAAECADESRRGAGVPLGPAGGRDAASGRVDAAPLSPDDADAPVDPLGAASLRRSACEQETIIVARSAADMWCRALIAAGRSPYAASTWTA